MTHRRSYRISDLTDYINWMYFFHAWGLPVKYASVARIHACDACRASWVSSFETAEQARAREACHLYTDAQHMLARLTNYTSVNCTVRLMPCYSDGDDIILLRDDDKTATSAESCNIRLPFLRQQQPDSDGYCLCLADYVRPQGDATDTIGLFATTVHSPKQYTDDYASLLAQTLADRLAEAAAERLHQEVRTTLWGYAPDERLTMDELHNEQFQGLRPAVGYPSLPDLSFNFLLAPLLGFEGMGITLTEHGMMQPHASVSGLMFSLAAARYFSVGTITDEQLHDYARRRGLPADVLRTYLAANLQQNNS